MSAAPDSIEQDFYLECKRYFFVEPVAIGILPEEFSMEAMILDELDEVDDMRELAREQADIQEQE